MYKHFEYKLAINVAELLRQTALVCIGVPNNKNRECCVTLNTPLPYLKEDKKKLES